MLESYMKYEGFQSQYYIHYFHLLSRPWILGLAAPHRDNQKPLSDVRGRAIQWERALTGIKPASSWERIGQRGWAACRSLPLSPRQQANTSRGRGLYEHLADGDHMQPPAGRRHFPAISSPVRPVAPTTCRGVAFGGLETHLSRRSLQSPCRW